MSVSKFKKMDYEVFHKAFGGMKTRGEIDEYYNVINLLGKTVQIKKTRSKELANLANYYYGTQYNNLPKWTNSTPKRPIPVYKRQPKIIVPIPKKSANVISSHLFGEGSAPRIFVENNDNLTILINDVKKSFKFDLHMQEAVKRISVTGACLVRYYKLDETHFCMETYFSHVCYPYFNEKNELDAVVIQFVFRDTLDNKDKWFRLDLTREYEQSYNNPLYAKDIQPEFKKKKKITHDFGFVQATWLVNGSLTSQDFDGESMIADNLSIFDDINYQLSSQSDSVINNCMPQLTISGIDEDDAQTFLKSPESVWLLGKDGKASYIESKLEATKEGMAFVKMLQSVYSDVSGIPIEQHDSKSRAPTSGQALRMLMEGLVNNIQAFRTCLTSQLCQMITQMEMVFSGKIQSSFENENIGFAWYEVITDSALDIYQKAQAAALLIQNKIVSRETILKSFADDFGIQDIEIEIKKIEAETQKDQQNEMNLIKNQTSLRGNDGDS